jgi:hypothetical protein
VFENEKILSADIQQNGKFIETFDSSRKRRAVQEVYHDGHSFPTGGIQKGILDILRRSFFHDNFSFIKLDLRLQKDYIKFRTTDKKKFTIA